MIVRGVHGRLSVFHRLAGPGLLTALIAMGPWCGAQTASEPAGTMGAVGAGTKHGAETAMHMERTAPRRSDELSVSINGQSTQLSVAQLEAMAQTTVTIHNAHTHEDEQYTGVALADLFARLGLPQEHGPEQARLLHSYVRAQGTDNYFVIFSAVEVDRELHAGNVLVALKKNGKPLGEDGRLKLVSTEDTLPAREVRNLDLLTLSTVN